MSGKYQIYVRVDKEIETKFEELIKYFTNGITTPTKTDIIELAIKDLHEKYLGEE